VAAHPPARWPRRSTPSGARSPSSAKAFQASAVGNFGSGWTWLVKKADGSVDIVNMGAAGTPLTTGDKALLCIDVWEHAYYVDYRNMRPKFVETFPRPTRQLELRRDELRRLSRNEHRCQTERGHTPPFFIAGPASLRC
jgi:hypothetical protein